MRGSGVVRLYCCREGNSDILLIRILIYFIV